MAELADAPALECDKGRSFLDPWDEAGMTPSCPDAFPVDGSGYIGDAVLHVDAWLTPRRFPVHKLVASVYFFWSTRPRDQHQQLT